MIFARFMAIYGHKFKSCFDTPEELRLAKREWASSIAGIPEQVLVASIEVCKERYAWMPTVSEFLKTAREVTNNDGIPSAYIAYNEACQKADKPSQQTWSHPVVYHAGRATDWFKLRCEDENEVFPLFEYHYDQFVQRFRAGESLDLPVVKALENKSDLTLVSNANQLAKDYSLSDQVAASLLYYQTKPLGSAIRARLRAQAIKKANTLGIDLLPE